MASYEDELPDGWVRQYDTRSEHPFWVRFPNISRSSHLTTIICRSIRKQSLHDPSGCIPTKTNSSSKSILRLKPGLQRPTTIYLQTTLLPPMPPDVTRIQAHLPPALAPIYGARSLTLAHQGRLHLVPARNLEASSAR